MKILFAFLFVFSACSTGKKGVNEPKYQGPWALSGGYVVSGQNEPDPRKKKPAISGTVVLKSEMPQPIANIRLGIFKKKDEEWIQVLGFSTTADGRFHVVKGLEKGQYELRVLDEKYEGSANFNLTEPIENFIFEVTKK